MLIWATFWRAKTHKITRGNPCYLSRRYISFELFSHILGKHTGFITKIKSQNRDETHKCSCLLFKKTPLVINNAEIPEWLLYITECCFSRVVSCVLMAFFFLWLNKSPLAKQCKIQSGKKQQITPPNLPKCSSWFPGVPGMVLESLFKSQKQGVGRSVLLQAFYNWG